MQQHMGRLIRRVFLNKNIKDNYYIDICVSNKGERLLWYCWKSTHRVLCGICLDEKSQSIFFDEVDTKYDAEDLEHKIQLYFNNFYPEEYYNQIYKLRDDNSVMNIPKHIRFDREADPHVLMTDGSFIFHCLSNNTCENYLFELIMNSVQEYQIGEANKITIRIDKNKYEIIDDGSGIAVEDDKDLKDLEWKRIFVYPHIVFNYPQESSETNINGDNQFDSSFYYSDHYKKTPQYYYKGATPKRQHMPGATLAHAQCYAKAMSIRTIRGTKEYSFLFKNGYCVSGRKIKKAEYNARGTHIVWVPDECCFDETVVSADRLSSFLQQQSFLNPGLKISLDYNGQEQVFCYNNGLSDYLVSKTGSLLLPISKMKFLFNAQYNDNINYDEEVELVLGIGSSGFIEAYHNYRKMMSGVTIDEVYQIITDWLNKYIQNYSCRELFKEYENRVISTDNVKKHISVIVASFSEYTSFTSEAQKGVDDLFFEVAIKKSINTILSKYFGGWWAKEEDLEEAKRFFDMLLSSK